MYERERERERRQLAGVGGLFPGHQDVAGYLGRETGVLTRITRIGAAFCREGAAGG
jgi:hypothetical protein